MKTIVCCIMLAVVNLFFAVQYFHYYVNHVGRNLGQIVAIFLVPILFGVLTGALGIAIMCSGFRMAFYKKYWWILLLSAFLALLPSLYCVVMLMLVGDRGG